MNKLVELEAFINSLCRECTQLRNEFGFRDFCGFRCSCGVRIAANSHVVVGVIRKIEMVRDWFRSICHVFSTSRRCSRRRSTNLLPVSPMQIFLHSVQVMQ